MYIMVRLAELCLPLLSVAVTVSRLFPCANWMLLALHDDVPTQAPLPPRSFDQVTLEMVLPV